MTIFSLPIITLDYNVRAYTLIIFVFNTLTYTYLFFFNSWFRNKIVGYYLKFEAFEERH